MLNTHSSKSSIHSLVGRKQGRRQRRRRSAVEVLESRTMLSVAPISNSALASVGDVFYIDMENHNLTQPSPLSSPQQILNNPAAPFINGLIQQTYEGPFTFGGESGPTDVTLTLDTSSQVAGQIVLLNSSGQSVGTGTLSGTATGADAYSGTISGISNGPTTFTLTVGGTLSGTLGGPAGSGTFGPLTRDNAAAADTSWASDYQNAVQPNGTAVHPSEPNYIWQEGGSNFGVLGDDDDPYANNGNSNANENTNVKLIAATGNNPENLSGLLQNAATPILWKSYQEDIDLTPPSGGSVNQPNTWPNASLSSTVAPTSDWTVPLQSFSGSSAAYTNHYNNSNYYGFAVKHDGQLFYTATNGSSLSSPDFLTSNTEVSHYDPLQQLQSDLTNNKVGRYNLITPDLYNDMHNSLPAGTTFKYAGVTYDDTNKNDNNDQEAIAEGDNFLSMIIPEIMASNAYKDNGMIVIWDDEAEPGTSGPSYTMPEIVISPLAKGNSYDSTLTYTHSSDLKTMQELFNVTASTPTGYLGDTATSSLTANANDLTDLFQPVLSATASPVAATAAGAFSGTLVTFTDADGNTDASQYTATVDWGDGLTQTLSGSSISETAGTFTVVGSHTYAHEGTTTVTVTISDTDGASATVKPVATIQDASLTATGSPITATEGISLSTTVATFTDADPTGTTVDYTATIDWGDTSSLTTVTGSQITEAGGKFSVPGSHVYTEEGTYTVTVTISDTGGAMATFKPVATVGDASLTATGSPITGTEGISLSGTVATFTDADPAGSASDYTATIDWGDTSSLTTVTGSQITAAGNTFSVPDNHVYAEEGTYTITVTISDTGSTATFKPVATVDDASLTAVAVTFGAVQNTTFTGEVAAFSDANIQAPKSDFTATINWGDGKSSGGTVAAGTTPGSFTVTGSHLYSQNTTQTVTVVVDDAGGASVTVTSTAVFADVVATSSPVAIAPTEAMAFSGAVATFRGAELSGTSSDFTASIDWGDGKTDTGTISGTAAAGYTVNGAHTYIEEAAAEPIKVIISDKAGTLTTVVNTTKVADAPLSGTSASIAAGTTISGTVATFSDPDTGDATSDYTAKINWGDGNSDTGTVVAGAAAGQFSVTGNHTYSDGTAHTITVTVSHGSDQALVITSTEPGSSTPFSVINQTYTIGSGTITVAAPGLLTNDTAPSALAVTAATVTGTQGGTFVFNADGSFTYTPAANFPGFDSAQYTVTDASGDKATATVNVLSQHAAVVWKFYESVLNRTPDPGGLQYWTNYFNNGGQTGQMAVGFFESPELLDRIITNYYQDFLLRTPDSSGLSYWVGVWQATGGPEQIKAGFADSPEFYASAGGSPESWLTALYQRILNRVPDSQGLGYWENYYQQQTAAGVDAGTVRYEIALGFFDSAESYGDDVAGWFQEYLFRAPTSAEQAQYVSQMQAGANDRTIEEEITNLPEYANNPPTPGAGTATALPDFYQKGISP